MKLEPGLPAEAAALHPTVPAGVHTRAVALRTVGAHWHGLMLCAVVAVTAQFVAGAYGGPPMLYALLIGMSIYSVARQPAAAPGVAWCGRSLLRLGVALLGARVTADQLLALGGPTVAIVLAAVLGTLGVGLAGARLLGLRPGLGLVAGGATAICGASAALALSALLPRSPERQRDTAAVVVAASLLSTLALLLYPWLAQALALAPAAAGLFIGGSIHDVAQVLGAASVLGPQVLEAAVVVKMFRVSLLALLLLVVGLVLARQNDRADDGQASPLLPPFVLGFIALAALNSTLGLPIAVQALIATLCNACLLLAIAALGLGTSLAGLARVGLRPVLLMTLTTLTMGGAVLGGALWLSAR
jgi:uncharacterized integral membrane protein (TIGR00698 family)